MTAGWRRLPPDVEADLRWIWNQADAAMRIRCPLAGMLERRAAGIVGPQATASADTGELDLEVAMRFARITRALRRAGPSTERVLRAWLAPETYLPASQRRVLFPLGTMGGVMALTPALRAWRAALPVDRGDVDALETLRLRGKDPRAARVMAEVITQASKLIERACEDYLRALRAVR